MSDTAKVVREIVARAKSDIDGTVRGVEDKLKHAVQTSELAAHEQIGKLQFEIKASAKKFEDKLSKVDKDLHTAMDKIKAASSASADKQEGLTAAHTAQLKDALAKVDQAMKAVADFSSEAAKQREQMQSLIDKIPTERPPEPDPIEGFLLYKGEDGRTTEVKLVRGSA